MIRKYVLFQEENHENKTTW